VTILGINLIMSKNKIQKTKHELSNDFRQKVTKLEKAMLASADGENIIAGTKEKPIVTNSDKIPIKHFFMEGVYVREMTMFEGTAVVGAIHKHLHMCFLLSGCLTVTDENGTKDYIAPCYIISSPGIKRVLYAHEDSVWYNVHQNPTNTEDVKEIEENLVAINYEEYEKYINEK